MFVLDNLVDCLQLMLILYHEIIISIIESIAVILFSYRIFY